MILLPFVDILLHLGDGVSFFFFFFILNLYLNLYIMYILI